MCLPDFIEFKQIDESEAVTGYRNWRNSIRNDETLFSENQDYKWSKFEGPHLVKSEDSGIYSYNYYSYNNNYSYNYSYKYSNYYYNNNYSNYYNMPGIIKQWGKVAIHIAGYRSEYAKIETLFNIKEISVVGSNEFLEWVGKFNIKISKLAEIYECNVISWQDFIDVKR